MLFHVKEFEKKLIDVDLNRTALAKRIGISPSTLSSKVDKTDADFKITEALKIADELSLSDAEFMMIFFGKKLPPNGNFKEGCVS